MKCEGCSDDLRIASSFIEARQDDFGNVGIYSVVDLACTNGKCRYGKDGIPVKRVSRLIENSTNEQNAICCCSTPLAYVGATSYFVPQTTEASFSSDGRELSVACGKCGKIYLINIEGKTERKQG